MSSRDAEAFNAPRSAIVIPRDVEAVRPLRGISGEPSAQSGGDGDGPATPHPDEMATLRVTLRAVDIAPRGGLFKKPCDPVLSVQLMKSQHGDSDDPVGLLDGAEAIGPELSTTVVRKRRAVRFDEDFGLRWRRDPALYSKYFVLVVLRDASGRTMREVGHQVVRFANLPITVEDAGVSLYQGHWALRRFRDGDVQQQVAGSVEVDFTFEPPEEYQPPQNADGAATAITDSTPAAAATTAAAAHGSMHGAEAGAAAHGSVHGAAAHGTSDVAVAHEAVWLDGDVGDGEAVSTGDPAQWDVAASAAAAIPATPAGGPAPLDTSAATSRCPLPPGWVMCRTKNGREFFVDHSSKTTTFEDPRQSEIYSSFYTRRMHDQMQPRYTKEVGRAVIVEEEVPLPANWDERYDVDGRKFYVDHAKKKTTFVHPVSGKKTRKDDPTDAAAAAAADKLSPDFNRKLKKFRAALKEMRGAGPAATKQNILISRSDVLNTSLSTVMQLGPKDLQKTPYVTFFGERGLDYGGLQREWFYLLSHEIFNPAYGLFEYSSGDSYILQANPNSGLANPGHLTYFRFSGRILGMAVLHGGQIDAFFVKPVYKFLLGLPVTMEDMSSVDPEYYKNLQYVLENDPSPLNLTFSIDEEGIGETKTVDLVLDGSQMDVTMENRNDYVQLICERRFVERCREQMDALRSGFNEVVPRGLLSSFDANELEVLVGGTADISVQDWRKNTVFSGGYTSYSPTVQWFWEAVLSYTPEQRARLLQFATASSRVPMNGFAELQGSNGPQRFNLRQWGCIKDLPRAHTCFNRIDIPAYNSFKLTKEKLLLAIENTEGFDGVD